MRWLLKLLERRRGRQAPAPSPLLPPSQPLPARQRAQALVDAVDAGGLPLHPARVNDIARNLGLPVSKSERVGDTVARIRACLRETRP